MHADPPLSGTKKSGARERIFAILGPALLVAVAGMELRLAFAPGHVPGAPLGESWGRLFVTAQVSRWFRGEAPWGVADLAGWPERVTFWPTDPAVQLLAVPLSAAFGDARGLTLVTLLLAALAGIGPYVLARTLGAGRWAATAAGLLVQVSPYLLRNLADLVLEVEAVGPLALAGAAMISAARAIGEGRPARRALLWVGLSVFALAGSSPYYAVYLAGIAALAALFRPRAWRASLAIGAVGALACGLALAPLIWTEGGARGRLGPQYQGRGYHPSPGAMVHADGSPWKGPRVAPRAGPGGGDPVAAPLGEESEDERPRSKRGGRSQSEARIQGARSQEPAWKYTISRLPGGGVALLALGLGLALPRGRPLAMLGLVVFLVGPGPGRLGALSGLWSAESPGLAQELLRRLPMTNTMGNPTRILAPFIVLAAASCAAGLGARRSPAALLAGLALAESWLHQPWLGVPATRLAPPLDVLEALDGPTIVFPSGDPPLWHPGLAPKEVLYLAGLAGVPVAYDYGRGRRPSDLQALVRLCAVADAPMGDAALYESRPMPSDADLWGRLDFQHILVLEDRLSVEQAGRLHAWLSERATLLAEEPGASAWSLPGR